MKVASHQTHHRCMLTNRTSLTIDYFRFYLLTFYYDLSVSCILVSAVEQVIAVDLCPFPSQTVNSRHIGYRVNIVREGYIYHVRRALSA